MPGSGGAFCGGFHRNAPVGGAAYGIPLKLRIVELRAPTIVPTFGTVTVSGPATLSFLSPLPQATDSALRQAIESVPIGRRSFMGRHPREQRPFSPTLQRSIRLAA